MNARPEYVARFWDRLAENMTEVPFNCIGTFYVLKTAAAAALLYLFVGAIGLL
jgi:hypothetical protein